MNNINLKKSSIYERFYSWLMMSEKKTLLKFLMCSSMDDGKSTLIKRIIHDTQQIYENQLFFLKNNNKLHEEKSKNIDFSIIFDRLTSQKDLGMTIDMECCYFSTNKRKFIISNIPSHEKYIYNMAIVASTCDLSVLLVDAKKNISSQIYRNGFISILLGIKYLVIAINKMDLVKYQEKVFLEIKKAFLLFISKISKKINIFFIPISALTGENIVLQSKFMFWYKGPTLLNLLENIEINNICDLKKIRFLVQYINKSTSNFFGYSGILLSGTIHVGEKIKILPINIISHIFRILIFEKDVKIAESGQLITIVLKDEINIHRGDFFVSFNSNLKPSYEAIVDIVWMTKDLLKIGKSYNVKLSGKKTRIYIKDILFYIDTKTLLKKKTNSISLNNIGRVKIIFSEPMIFDDYTFNKVTGSLIFNDIFSNITVGAGMFKKEIKQEENIVLVNKNNFSLDFFNLIKKYFPHWNIKNI